MSFGTFLSTLGKYLAEGIAVLTGIEPIVAPLFGSKAQQAASTATTVVNDLNSIAQVVVSAEALIQTPGSGAQKLQAATPLVANILKTSQLLSGHQIANETLFLQASTDITNGVAELLNSLDAKSLKSSGQPQPAAPATPTPEPAPQPPVT